MRTISILTLAILITAFSSCKKDDIEINGLVIEINGLRNNEGVIQFELTDEDENVLQTISTDIADQKSTITLSDLGYGTYAFKYFHDENTNQELDTNLSIPQEGYGFSNNASGTFGPPKIEDMIFEYKEPMIMKCNISYLF